MTSSALVPAPLSRQRPNRQVVTWAVPVGGHTDELAAQSGPRNISIEEMVALLLMEHLPIVLAEENRVQLTGALATAYRHAALIDHNEQSPVADDHEALNGEEISLTNAERQYTARSAPKAASGVSTD